MKIIKILKMIKNLFSKYDEIISIEECGNNDVIDIEVDGDHLFYANNLLTHNSSSGSGYAGEEISMSNTSDSAGINMDADALFALYQVEGERELGRVNVKILKNRLGGYVDTIFPMLVDYDTLKISDWSGDEEETELENKVFTDKDSDSDSDDAAINNVFQNL